MSDTISVNGASIIKMSPGFYATAITYEYLIVWDWIQLEFPVSGVDRQGKLFTAIVKHWNYNHFKLQAKQPKGFDWYATPHFIVKRPQQILDLNNTYTKLVSFYGITPVEACKVYGITYEDATK